jgi:hypothetical protein
MLRSLAVAAVIAAAPAFHATARAQAPLGFQPPPGSVVTPQQVLLLGPQLLPFAGSSANLEALVQGLSQGIPVTLVTPLPGGLAQTATFTPPAGGLSASDIARTLEIARSNLIAQGIAAPSAQQIAVALAGGGLPTALGSTVVSGVLGGTTANSVQVRNDAAAATQAIAGLRQGSAVTVTSGSGQTLSFTPPGGPISDLELNHALLLAGQLLASLGILNPTPEQLRTALLGGNLALASGSVPLQGVLQGRLRFTSESPSVGTSNSPTVGTRSSVPSAVAPAPGAFSLPPGNAGPGGTAGVPALGVGAAR